MTAPTSRSHIAILGGAIIGSMTAWFLRQGGHAGPITVVEQDPTYRLSSTALSAASIRTQFATPLNIRLSLFGVDFLRRIKQNFGASADVGYAENGYLILGDADSAEARRAAARMQRDAGADVEVLDPDALAARFPFLSLEGIGIGTFGASGEGWFDAWSLLSLVRGGARDQDVRYLTARAVGFDTQNDRITALRLEDGERLACDTCVLAAGPASGRLAVELGIDLPVSPRKRTVFNFRAPVTPQGFPMLFDASGIWVRPEGEGFIGGIQPPEDQDPDATGDFEPHHELMMETFWPLLAERIPAMQELRLERAWAGHYEVNALDHNGIVGRHDRIGNLILATGFSGHGVMHAPAVGRAVSELLIHGGYRTLDLSPLGWERVRDNRPMVESVII